MVRKEIRKNKMTTREAHPNKNEYSCHIIIIKFIKKDLKMSTIKNA